MYFEARKVKFFFYKIFIINIVIFSKTLFKYFGYYYSSKSI